VKYDADEENSMLECADTAAVTPLAKEALVKKLRDELLQQRMGEGLSSEGILTPLPPNFDFPKMSRKDLSPSGCLRTGRATYHRYDS